MEIADLELNGETDVNETISGGVQEQKPGDGKTDLPAEPVVEKNEDAKTDGDKKSTSWKEDLKKNLAEAQDAAREAKLQGKRRGRPSKEEATQKPADAPKDAAAAALPQDKAASNANAKIFDGNQHLTAEEKSKLHALPPEQQKLFSDILDKRDRGVDKKLRQVGYELQTLDHIEREIAPHMEKLKPLGYTTFTAIKELTDLYSMYTKDPKAYLKLVASQAGISLNLADDANKGEGQTGDHTAQNALQTRLDKLESTFQAEQRAREDQIKQSYDNAYNTFAAAKDAKGQSLRPHADNPDVLKMMNTIVNSGQLTGVKTVPEAYEKSYLMATRALGLQNPTPAQAQARAANSDSLERAKNAAAIKTARASPRQEPPASMTWKDEIKARLSGELS